MIDADGPILLANTRRNAMKFMSARCFRSFLSYRKAGCRFSTDSRIRSTGR